MPDRRSASRLRQRIVRLGRELAALQERLLKPRRMIAASLIERRLGTRAEKRASTAFYLSSAEGGRTRLVHVSKDQVERVRERVEAWRSYRAGVRRWREVAALAAELLGALGEAQAERWGGRER